MLQQAGKSEDGKRLGERRGSRSQQRKKYPTANSFRGMSISFMRSQCSF